MTEVEQGAQGVLSDDSSGRISGPSLLDRKVSFNVRGKVKNFGKNAKNLFGRIQTTTSIGLKEFQSQKKADLNQLFFKVQPHVEAVVDVETVFDDHLRMINAQMSSCAVAAVILILVYNDLCFDRSSLVFSEAFEICPEAFYFKVVAWILYGILILRLMTYYYIQSTRKMKFWGYENRWTAFTHTDLLKRFWIEVLINTVMPLPSPSDWSFINNVIIFLSFFRIYLIIRLGRDFSTLYQSRNTLKNKKLFMRLDETNYTIDYETVYKSYFYKYTSISVATIFLILTFFLSYMMFLTERQYWINTSDGSTYRVIDHNELLPDPIDKYYKSPFVDYGTCLWFTMVTMATLGYGDVLPLGWQGKVFSALTVLIGIIVFSIMVGVLTNKLTRNSFQTRVADWQVSNELRSTAHLYAALLIQTAWRENQKFKDGLGINRAMKENAMKTSIRPYIKKLRAAKFSLREVEYRFSEKEERYREEEELQAKMKHLVENLDKVLLHVKTKTNASH